MPIIKQLKNAVKPSLHVGSETTCGPVTGLQYEVIGAAGRLGVSGSNDVAQSQKAALQRHARQQENRSLQRRFKNTPGFKSAVPRPCRKLPGGERRSADHRPADSSEISSGKSDTEPFSLSA